MGATEELRALLDERIAVLDGSWGVLIHRRGLTEADYRGSRLAESTRRRPVAREVSGGTSICMICTARSADWRVRV